MTPQEEAARIVAALVSRGFSQTDIARGLGLTAKGSGSYVGQVAKGLKGAGKVGELRALARAASGKTVPEGRGREATARRQAILGGGQVVRVPRKAKSGAEARVRTPGAKISPKGFGQAFDASAGIQSGAPNCTKLIEKYAAYGRGRIAIRVVARFPSDAAAHRSQYWRRFYGKRKHAPNRKRGSRNVLEASFGNGHDGYSAADWLGMIETAGSFTGALREWLDGQGIEVPERLLRVEVTAWVEKPPLT
jgi:transcriptional regulator with XRE-family HTH domain